MEEYLRLKEKGKEPRIITRGGDAARIICTDRKAQDGCVVALINNGIETIWNFYENGQYSHNIKGNRDLFFADLEEEPKYRPYKDAEECFKDVLKHGGWVIYDNTATLPNGSLLHMKSFHQITKITAESVHIGHFERYPILLDNYTWADDGSPCGVKEE